ncbi:MAG TPA: hypothetical protein VIK81_04810 [Patescibacteria group bacterium]
MLTFKKIKTAKLLKHPTKYFPQILFVILILLIILVLIVKVAFKDKFPDKKLFKPTDQKQTIVTPTQITLPVSLSNRNLGSVYLAYNFFGPVKEIKNISQGKQLILNTSDSDLPTFVINDRTGIFKIENDKSVTTKNVNDLKSGQRVSISTTYDLKSLTWTTRTIHLVD